MRVLIGSHGTGKTTLLNALTAARPEMYVTDGFSRPLHDAQKKMGFSDKDRQQITNTLYEWLWTRNIKQKNMFTTRSIIDVYIYSKLAGYHDLAEHALEIFENSNYHQVEYFYLPIEFTLEKDGIRNESSDFQQEVDMEMKRIIKKYNLKATPLTGTVTQRLNSLLNQIEK